MNVTIMTLGSRGDVQPFIAFACGLRQAGYRVRIATHVSFESFVRGFGFDFAPMPGDPRELLTQDVGRNMAGAQDPVSFIRSLMTIEGLLASLLDYAREALNDTDVVVYSTLAFVAAQVAESIGIPAIAVHLQPLVKSAEYPHILFPPSVPPQFNWTTHILSDVMIEQTFGPTVRRWRRKLGLSWRRSHGLLSRQIPTLHAYSSHVFPKPSDWGEAQEVTGYWFLDAPTGWRPPSSLETFLAQGEAPICITFGSMGSTDPVRATKIVVEALQTTGHRGILIGGWGGFDGSELPDDVFLIDEVPHSWLFPRAYAVVSHGGAGTTAAALRAGVPAILIPTGMDQPFWAHRVEQLGVGPAGIPRKHLDSARLIGAIQAVDRDPEMRKRAASLGERIQKEQGVFQAVQAFERFVGKATIASQSS